MKSKIERNTLLVLVLVGIIAAIVFSIYVSPSNNFDQSKIYFEPEASFSFQVPSSFNIQREAIADDEVVLKIVAPNDVSSANPGLADVVVYKQVEGKSLQELAAAFISVDPGRLIPFNFTSQAFSYLAQNGQELSYYYFIENNDYVIVYKFNKSYYDKNNPLILIDNSTYANTFLRTLSSTKFL